MLKSLTIRNLILVEEANLELNQGFTVITGETGAGKTALLEAIRLILGERSDATKVRKGTQKAFVSATFEGEHLVVLAPIFEESGIEFSIDEPLILSREITLEGKNRSFAMGKAVPLSFLQKIAPHLIDFIGQGAQHELRQSQTQGELLDLYGEIDRSSFQTAWKREKERVKELKALRERKVQLETEAIEENWQRIEALQYKKGEEEELFEELSLLSNATTITEQALVVCEKAERAQALVVEIKNALTHLPLADGSQMAKEAHLQLQELQRQAWSLSAKVEHNPSRIVYCEERLAQIEGHKRKFGKDLEEVQRALRAKMEELGGIDLQIANLEQTVDEARNATKREAEGLTEERKLAAKQLEEELSKGLQELEIESAEVHIQIEAAERSPTGEDLVTFFLRANRGEKLASIKQSSSGGEVSRLLFCIKGALSKKMGVKTLIFDEIDANVGGKAGSKMGEKMHLLAEGRQVFCITHFPQVARFAQNHIFVSKVDSGARTICTIQELNPEARQEEYLRMIGGAQMLGAASP